MTSQPWFLTYHEVMDFINAQPNAAELEPEESNVTAWDGDVLNGWIVKEKEPA